MKRAITLFCLSIILIYSCGTKQDQSASEVNEADSNKLNSSEELTQEPEEQNNLDEIVTEGVKEVTGPSSVQVYKLKWKSVSYDEYGISYGFENTKGEDVYFFHLNIPGFTDKQNDFYTSAEAEDRIFPVLEIKEEVKNKWFEVKVEIQEIENDAEPSETNDLPVIISIKPI